MRPDPQNLSLAARVDPHDVVRYAQAAGWVLARSARGAFHVLTHPESNAARKMTATRYGVIDLTRIRRIFVIKGEHFFV